MKHVIFIIGLLLSLFAFCLSAQSMNKEQTQVPQIKTLWVVDNVALNDSVLDYTLEQMRSDSAAVLASRALSWVYQSDIESISVIDSVSAAEDGFVNCNGVVIIATKLHEPLLVVINGCLYESKGKASAGEILGGYDRIQHIVHNEFRGLKECGIKESKVLRQGYIGFHQQKYPLVVITTELPYYRADILEGKYFGKRGRQYYELTLNADSTYMFSYNITHKEAIAQKISCHDTWNISHDDIILNSRQDPAIALQGLTESLKNVRLKINSAKTLTLPKGVWNNKKSITLKRQYNESDR